MPSKSKTTKLFKRENQAIQKPAQEKLPKRRFKYFIKHEVELNDQSQKEQLRKRSHVQKWKLNGEKGAEELDRQLEFFIKKISEPRNNIKKLVLENCKLSHISEAKLNKANEGLKKQSSFEGFTYLLSKGKKPCENEDLHSIRKLLKRVKHLKKFYLHLGDLPSYHKITNGGLYDLTQTLKEKRRLQDIRLFFAWCNQVTDKGIQVICKSMEKRTPLKALQLSLVNCQKITKTGAQAIRKMLERFVSLQKISLNFNGSPKTLYEGLKEIFNGIESSKSSFCEVSLKLGGQNLEDAQVEKLSQALKKTSSLQSFFIEFQSSESGVLQLSKALGNLHKLEKLTIDWDSFFSKTGLISLSENLKELTCLKQISLRFPQDRNITDEGLKSIAESLGCMISLQDLTLIFFRLEKPTYKAGGLDKVSDSGLADIIQVLTKLPSIKRLDLTFRKALKITDKSLENLNECLKNRKLESLSLDFSECILTDEGVQSLGKIMEKMNSLRDLRFIFESCRYISLSEVKCLAQNLKSLKYIERIEMAFSSYISQVEINRVCKSLRAIPSVKSVNIFRV